MEREKVMPQKNKMILYSIILLMGIITFILELSILEIDGFPGFLITLISIIIIIVSIIRLYKLSAKFKTNIKSIIHFFFNIDK